VRTWNPARSRTIAFAGVISNPQAERGEQPVRSTYQALSGTQSQVARLAHSWLSGLRERLFCLGRTGAVQ
jgi:hypothetical protein